MAFIAECDNCGAKEPARPYKEPSQKPQWCEPAIWLRRFDKDSKVEAIFCCFNCEKAYLAERASKSGGKKRQGT